MNFFCLQAILHFNSITFSYTLALFLMLSVPFVRCSSGMTGHEPFLRISHTTASTNKRSRSHSA
jgi:hypothetical protein